MQNQKCVIRSVNRETAYVFFVENLVLGSVSHVVKVVLGDVFNWQEGAVHFGAPLFLSFTTLEVHLLHIFGNYLQ